MEGKKLCIFNWSGGKDSTLALHYVMQDPLVEIKYLVTTVTEKFNRVSMHGVREALLINQAASIGIPLYIIRLPEMPDMETYDDVMNQHLRKFKEEGITHSIFGDIFLADLRAYREEKLNEVGLKAIFPLWGQNTAKLIAEFLKLNYKTIIVCAQQNLQSICGEIINSKLISELPVDINPCGENGEFHTFVYEGPIFAKKIDFELGEKVFRTYNQPSIDNSYDTKNLDEDKLGYWFINLI